MATQNPVIASMFKQSAEVIITALSDGKITSGDAIAIILAKLYVLVDKAI